jgi:hypothetical protein
MTQVFEHSGIMAKEKRQIFAQTGRRGGLAKVPKGVVVLSSEERIERTRQAAQARWAQKNLKKFLRPSRPLRRNLTRGETVRLIFRGGFALSNPTG